jgi:hypothetical protein
MQTTTAHTEPTAAPLAGLTFAETLAEYAIREAKAALDAARVALKDAPSRYTAEVVAMRKRQLERKCAALLNLRAFLGTADDRPADLD